MIIGKRNERRLVGDRIAPDTGSWVVANGTFGLHFMKEGKDSTDCGAPLSRTVAWVDLYDEARLLLRVCQPCFLESERLGVPLPFPVPAPDWYANRILRQTHFFDGLRSLCTETLYHPDLGWRKDAAPAQTMRCGACARRAPLPRLGYYDRVDTPLDAVPLYAGTNAQPAEEDMQWLRRSQGGVDTSKALDWFFEAEAWKTLQNENGMKLSVSALLALFRLKPQPLFDGGAPNPRMLLDDEWYGRAVITKAGIQHHPALRRLRANDGEPTANQLVFSLESRMEAARRNAGLTSQDTTVDTFILQKLQTLIRMKSIAPPSDLADWYRVIGVALLAFGR